MERRPDLASLKNHEAIAVGLVIPLVASLVAMLPVALRGRRGLGAPALWLAVLCGLAPLVFAGATWLTNPADTEPDFWNLAARCAWGSRRC